MTCVSTCCPCLFIQQKTWVTTVFCFSKAKRAGGSSLSLMFSLNTHRNMNLGSAQDTSGGCVRNTAASAGCPAGFWGLDDTGVWVSPGEALRATTKPPDSNSQSFLHLSPGGCIICVPVCCLPVSSGLCIPYLAHHCSPMPRTF